MPYGRQSIDEDDIEAVRRVLEGDWLTTGPTVTRFEDELTALAGGNRAVSCTSGTAALHIAYAALGVGAGDQVITTPMTFVATASQASVLGAEIAFADIDVATGLIDPQSVADRASDRTKVIAAVDYAGQPADYDRLTDVAADHGAFVLADAAHSIGASRGGRPVGSLADATTFSFFPTKNLTTGEGGAAVFRDPAQAAAAQEFHFIGLMRDPARFRFTDEGAWHQEVHSFGHNYRLTDIACALGLSQLRRLERFKAHRQQIVDLYDQSLAEVEGLVTPTVVEDADPMWHLYSVQVLDGRRREVYERMRAAGIGVQVNYIPVYWHPVYADLGYQRGLCPQAELYYSRQLSLPCFPDMTQIDVQRVIEELRMILE